MKKNTLNKRQIAAQKAAETRRARREFGKKYSEDACMATYLLLAGKKNEVDDAVGCWISKKTISAYKALLNRDCAFSRMARACNWR